MAEDDEADEPEGGNRVLDQDEIDSLLGFDGYASDENEAGISLLINSALVNYERLPMLEVVYDRLVWLITTCLRNFTSANVLVSIEPNQYTRVGDYMYSLHPPTMTRVF